MVRRWGGYLFASTAEAEKFAKGEMLFGDKGPPHARQMFARKRVDGLRVYVHMGQAGGGGC